jgi:hypothetical protein
MPRLVQLAAAVACLAGVSQAFLLPPSMGVSSVSATPSIGNTLTDAFHHAEELSVAIMCPGCLVPSNMLNEVGDKPESLLRLNVSFSRDQDADKLLVNGLTIYPNLRFDGLVPPTLNVDQLVKSPSGWDFTGSHSASYTLTTIYPRHVKSKQPLSVVQSRLSIIAIDGRKVDVPTLAIRLFEAPNGALMLDNIEVTTSTHGCNTLICAWQAYIKDKFSKLKGCSGKHRPHHGVVGIGSTAPVDHTHERPQFFHSHHHHKHTGFMKFLHVAAVRVLIPVMLGILIGATASIVGIVVGHMAIYAWRTLFRRGQRPACSGVQSDDDSEDSEESKGLVLHQEAPPVYEEAPVYTEAVVSEKVSQ